VLILLHLQNANQNHIWFARLLLPVFLAILLVTPVNPKIVWQKKYKKNLIILKIDVYLYHKTT